MASLLDQIADALARDILRVIEETGDEDIAVRVASLVGDSSTTLQEAVTTMVRVRRAEARARRLLADRVGAEWPLAASVGPSVVMAAPPAEGRPAPARVAAARAEAPEAEDWPEDRPEGLPAQAEASAVAAPAPREGPVPAPEPAPEPAPDLAPDPAHLDDGAVDGRIRPRQPTSPAPPKSAPPSAPRSIEAALALAAALPRKPLAQVEAPRTDPLYPDIEMPDGDWG